MPALAVVVTFSARLMRVMSPVVVGVAREDAVNVFEPEIPDGKFVTENALLACARSGAPPVPISSTRSGRPCAKCGIADAVSVSSPPANVALDVIRKDRTETDVMSMALLVGSFASS